MYVVKASSVRSADLEQGDILVDVLLPSPPGPNTLFRRATDSVNSHPIPAHANLATEQVAQLEVATPVARETVLVVSNTCDMSGGGAITVVPVLSLKLDAAAGSLEKQWKEVQRRATSGTWAKSFYLGPMERVGLQRSQALLTELVTLHPGYVDRLLSSGGARRLVSLNSDGVHHLRWALGYFFGRNSRELNDWHSDDDLLLRRRALDSTPAPKRDDAWRREVEEVSREMGRRGLSLPEPLSA